MIRILLIDDIQFNQILIHSLLSDWGFEVITASNGAEGLNTFRKDPNFDLIILDLMMPVMNGFDFLAQFRKENSGIPILIVSARHDAESITKALKLGANDYLTKPFNTSDLHNKVVNLLKTES